MSEKINQPAMTILADIIAVKQLEVELDKAATSIADLERKPFFNRDCFSLTDSLLDQQKTSIITEFKRASPSKGYFNKTADVEAVTAAYAKYGASGISILTDNTFFKGNAADLKTARKIDLPLLRKDFIIDEYQVIQSRAMGADVILLIAACLSKQQLKSLSSVAFSIGLDVLLEIHDEKEIDHINENIKLVGINSRNLETFHVDLAGAERIAEQLTGNFILIAESGINDPAQVNALRKKGFQGFLIGEKFMKDPDPGEAFQKFAEAL